MSLHVFITYSGDSEVGIFWTRELHIQTSKPKSKKYQVTIKNKKNEHKKVFLHCLDYKRNDNIATNCSHNFLPVVCLLYLPPD